MFTSILIANRGEIACRVAATARRLGIHTVAVYSDADAAAAHVAACDEAVRIGPAPVSESYLLGDRIIEAALARGAQAIHPGYGFLSENAAFTQACEAAGLVFIGPPAAAIRAMGSKSAAKTLMQQAGVPLVPGYHGDNQDAEFLCSQAGLIGYPVLLKASAGGGGKGMRIVERADDFGAALASCKREAMTSFGDDKVLVEKYLTQPRHIEIQLFGDTLGNYVYLFERDCSVQRRHQKVLEEAPAPGMTAERRAAMGAAAIAAAKAVAYVGAGTVEFIANQDGSFYFMEMNTRLQVEHPVTEMITGTDLVEWQLRVAAGQPLPLPQDQLFINGHAMEARVYAENPEKGFLPSTGQLRHQHQPQAVNFMPGGAPGLPAAVRIDSGIRQGDTISPFYDPMLAKLIVWGRDREEALARMSAALGEYQIVGLSSNVTFLKRLVQSPPFAAAELDTGLIERHHDVLFPPTRPATLAVLALAIAALLESEKTGTNNSDPWDDHSGWCLNGRWIRKLDWVDEQGKQTVTLAYLKSGYRLSRPTSPVDGAALETMTLRSLRQQGVLLSLVHDEGQLCGSVVCEGDQFHVFSDGAHALLTLVDPLAQAAAQEIRDGRLTAPMPGKIVAIHVEAGQQVAAGTALLVMEAMKMEHTLHAPAAGVVGDILFSVNDQVGEGVQLLTLEQAAS